MSQEPELGTENPDPWDDLLAPWFVAGPTHPERLHTPWAVGNWHAWNEHAVEVETAEFIAQLVAEIAEQRKEASMLVVETGTGQGYLTRAVQKTYQGSMICYESDANWRIHLRERKIFPRKLAQLSRHATPNVTSMATADLVLLDSMDPWRMAEVCLWAAAAKPGSFLFVHDTGNGHPSWDGHYTLGTLIRTLQIPGRFLENPRGSFLACQDSVLLPPWAEALWENVLAETGLQALSAMVQKLK